MHSPPAAHQDAWQGYGSLITVLVAVHAVAFVVWLGLLVASERKRAEEKERKQD